MTTGHEIFNNLIVSSKIMDRIARRYELEMKDVFIYGIHVALGRIVCARRARKLRRRGEDVRPAGFTATGKARYRWSRRIPPLEVMLP